jgi:hypothetical protein
MERTATIGLGDDQQLGLEKDGRVLERLVFSLSNAEQDNLGSLAEVITRRTNQVADVFNEKQVYRRQLPVGEVTFDHPRIEMASATRRDLLYRESEAPQASSVVFGLNIASEHCYSLVMRKGFERLFEERSFARSGRADQIQAERPMLTKPFAQFGGDAVVFVENFLFKGYSVHAPPFRAHPTRYRLALVGRRRCIPYASRRIAGTESHNPLC